MSESFLTRHAQKDIRDLEPDYARQIKNDLARLAKGNIPSAQTKKLRSFIPPI